MARTQKRTDEAFADLARAQERTELSIQRLTERISDLEVAQRRTEESIQQLSKEVRHLQIIVKHHTTRLARIEDKVTKASFERQEMKEKLTSLESGQNELRRITDDLRGWGYEERFRSRADAIFGRFLRRGKKKRAEIGDLLDAAEDNGQITVHEGTQVLASDLLWGGKLKSTKELLFLVVEVSFTAELTDVQRAVTRAGILRSIELPTLPVVAGINWSSDTVNEATASGVVILRDVAVDQTSWEDALSLI